VTMVPFLITVLMGRFPMLESDDEGFASQIKVGFGDRDALIGQAALEFLVQSAIGELDEDGLCGVLMAFSFKADGDFCTVV
jgi:hypothetical protein